MSQEQWTVDSGWATCHQSKLTDGWRLNNAMFLSQDCNGHLEGSCIPARQRYCYIAACCTTCLAHSQRRTGCRTMHIPAAALITPSSRPSCAQMQSVSCAHPEGLVQTQQGAVRDLSRVKMIGSLLASSSRPCPQRRLLKFRAGLSITLTCAICLERLDRGIAMVQKALLEV